MDSFGLRPVSQRPFFCWSLGRSPGWWRQAQDNSPSNLQVITQWYQALSAWFAPRSCGYPRFANGSQSRGRSRGRPDGTKDPQRLMSLKTLNELKRMNKIERLKSTAASNLELSSSSTQPSASFDLLYFYRSDSWSATGREVHNARYQAPNRGRVRKYWS